MSGKHEDYISWDEYFMGVAYLPALCLKDPNMQVGACIVSDDNKILSMDYNGLLRGYLDDEFPWGKEHEQDDPYQTKYSYVTHSGLNAILDHRGDLFESSKLYVTLFPCNECAKATIQSGIRIPTYGEDKYGDTVAVCTSKRMLNTAGVRYYQHTRIGRKLQIIV